MKDPNYINDIFKIYVQFWTLAPVNSVLHPLEEGPGCKGPNKAVLLCPDISCLLICTAVDFIPPVYG